MKEMKALLVCLLMMAPFVWADGGDGKPAAIDMDQASMANSLFDSDGFHNISELGFVQSEGNSDAQTTNFQQSDSYRWNVNEIKGVYQFLRSESHGVESTRRWALGAIFDRDISSILGWYAYQGYQSDIYAGYNLRANTEGGMRYNFHKGRLSYWFTYLGARYTSEKRVDSPALYSDYGHVYMEVDTIWGPAISTQLLAEYLPNFSHPKDYLVNYEASITSLVTRIFSIKSSYRVEYTNSPPPKATHQRDSLLTTSLVARF